MTTGVGLGVGTGVGTGVGAAVKEKKGAKNARVKTVRAKNAMSGGGKKVDTVGCGYRPAAHLMQTVAPTAR